MSTTFTFTTTYFNFNNFYYYLSIFEELCDAIGYGKSIGEFVFLPNLRKVRRQKSRLKPFWKTFLWICGPKKRNHEICINFEIK